MYKLGIIIQLIALSNAGPALLDDPPKTFEKIVMDVDAGPDDAFAMTLIIKNEYFCNGPPLIAITCVNGNTNLKNVKTNVLRTLRQLNRIDIPVYTGANESLFGLSATDSFFGEDGFGDFCGHACHGLPRIQKEHAVTALIRLVTANPGQITLMALGPLTNIALALKLDPYFIRKLKNLVILGGTVRGVGNVRPGIEFNALIDPEALFIVLAKSHYTKVRMFPWDSVVSTNISMEWRREVLGKVDSDDIRFLNKAEAADNSASWFHGDGMAAGSYIWPDTVKNIQPLRVSAVPCGEARGGLLVDYFRADQNVSTSNVRLILDFDGEEYKLQLLKLFQMSKNETPKKRINNKNHRTKRTTNIIQLNSSLNY